MKMKCTVNEVSDNGQRLTVRLLAETLTDESRHAMKLHELEIPNTAQAREAYRVGRTAIIEIKLQ